MTLNIYKFHCALFIVTLTYESIVNDATTNRARKSLLIFFIPLLFQEMCKLITMDLVMSIASILFVDFFRGLWVRYCSRWWCWSLETFFVRNFSLTVYAFIIVSKSSSIFSLNTANSKLLKTSYT